MKLKPTTRLFALLTALLMPLFLQAQKKQSQRYYHLLIGTYTNGTSKGIYVYKYDTQTGAVVLEQVANAKDPAYLAVSADHRFIYAANESHNPKGDTVSAFKFDDRSGKLTNLNKLPSYGNDPCYVSVDKNNRNLFVANYSSGSLSVYPLKADGSMGDSLQTFHHTGGSVDPDRQKTAHVHAVVLSPDEKYLMADDLGTDKVYEYIYQPKNKNKPLTPAVTPTFAVKPGSGPRHLVFSADAKHAYLVQEMGALVTVFNYNHGKLNIIQTIPMEDATFKGKNGAADIHLSPNGNFLYASNRGEANDLVVYKVDKATGKLSFVERQSTLGNGPRNFAIDPSGNFLLAANQNTDDIYTFKINKTTGKLSRAGTKLEISHPVCLKFVAIR